MKSWRDIFLCKYKKFSIRKISVLCENKEKRREKVLVVCIYMQNVKYLKSKNIFSLILSKVKKYGVKTKKSDECKEKRKNIFQCKRST